MTLDEQLRIIDRGDDDFAPDRLLLAYMLIDKNKRGTSLGDAVRGPDTAQIPQMITDRFTRYRSLVERLQIPHKIEEPHRDSEGVWKDIWRFEILCARNIHDLQAFDAVSTAGDGREFGLFVGYPETAVKAFVNNTLLDRDEALKGNEDLAGFLTFQVSRTHTQAELKLVRQHREMVRQKCPRLFAERQGGIKPWLRYYVLRSISMTPKT